MCAKKKTTKVAKKKKVEKAEVVVQRAEAPAMLDPEALIGQAIQSGASVETMERLLAMRKELKAEWSKEQFDISMAKFQAECPVIQKTKEVKNNEGKVVYKYAPVESIVSQVKQLVQKHGFSYAIQTAPTNKGVQVDCTVRHEAGHSEVFGVMMPFGSKTKMMSDTQVTASAMTFGKRLSFSNAFGILTGDDDNDGVTAGKSASPSGVKPRVATLKELEDRARKGIETAKDSGTVIKVDEFCQKEGKKSGGKDFSKKFKQEISSLASAKVDQLENGG